MVHNIKCEFIIVEITHKQKHCKKESYYFVTHTREYFIAYITINVINKCHILKMHSLIFKMNATAKTLILPIKLKWFS